MANLSQQKRERMLAFLDTLKKKNADDDDTLRAIGEIENELNSKKYGLVWEKHEEAVDIKMKDYIPVFTEDHDREITAAPGEGYNFLLEGDNLHSLKLLEKTHKGKIDVIYIDPPYNTGKQDFKYNDAFVDTLDGYKHSKWLSFMSERLSIARSLLSPIGVIFISIDDHEVSQLKLLCDEIFGENDFLGFIIQDKKNAKNDTSDIQKNNEFILAYRKQANYVEGSNTKVAATLVRHIKKVRPIEVENGRFFYIGDAITTRGEGGTLNARPNLGYTVYYNPDSGDKMAVADYDVELARTSNDVDKVYHHDKSLIDRGYIPIIPPRVRGKLGCWTWMIERFNENLDNVVITGKTGKYAVRKRTFVSPECVRKTDNGSLVYEYEDTCNSRSIIEYSTNDGTNALNSVLGYPAAFNNPKNVDMIKYFLELFPYKDATVLDFFAGSGTTAQAVLELNQGDGGNRHFILCTNNENNICENVTYPRVKTVITGIRPDSSKYSDGIPANLKYYKTDFVARNEEYLSDALLRHIAEMIQLENGIKLDGKKYLMILTDEQADDISSYWDQYPDVKAIYLSKNVLLTTDQETLFEKIPVYIIPDYYFDFELREEGESW